MARGATIVVKKKGKKKKTRLVAILGCIMSSDILHEARSIGNAASLCGVFHDDIVHAT